MAHAIMHAADAIAGSLAQCYITVGEEQYNFMQMINFEASIEKDKAEIPILGKTGKGHKAIGWSGAFKGTAHYNQSALRKLLESYKKTGQDTYFEIQIINQDPAVSGGEGKAAANGQVKKQDVLLKGCNLNGGVLAKFDAGAEYLEEDVEGTFEDFEILSEFDELPGFRRSN